jgi:putative ATP-binding cassette transporter
MNQLLSLLFRHSLGMAMLAVLAGVVGGLANAALIALINAALHRDAPRADPRLVWTFVALCLLLPLTQAFSTWVLTRLTQRSTLRLRVDLSRRILSAPMRKLEQVGAHRLQAALTEDVASIVIALNNIPLLAVQVAVVAGCLGYLGWLSLKALVAVVVALAVGIVTYQFPLSVGERFQSKGRANVDLLYEHFRAVTGGAKELKLHRRRRDALVDSLETTARGNHYWGVRAATLFSAAAGWGQLVILGTIGAVVFALPLLGPVSPTLLTGYALILLYMMGPLDTIMNTLPVFTRARVSLGQIERLGLSLGDAPAQPLPASPPGWRTLELVGVTHAYHREGEDADFTLGPVDLRFTPGEVVFITGGNGSGKTTLAKLIVGLYAPEGGEVRVDGRAVDAAGREAYSERFSVVFTDFFLFDRLLGIEAQGIDERAAHYLARLQLEHKVRVENGRLSTTDLSQGQRKRLALLTAYLEDRPIYLFDEWAADQDPVFKALFYRQLLPELSARGKTVLVISHDDHYYGLADRIVKMEYGRVEYDGPPSGLPGGAPELPALATATVPSFAPPEGR